MNTLVTSPFVAKVANATSEMIFPADLPLFSALPSCEMRESGIRGVRDNGADDPGFCALAHSGSTLPKSPWGSRLCLWMHVACMPLQRESRTTVFGGLVDTGDFYLGGENSSRTPALIQLVVRSYGV